MARQPQRCKITTYDENAQAMNELGHDISIEDVKKHASGSLGRPHLARAMIDYGIVETVQQAFDEWIGNGCPAKKRPLPRLKKR